MEKTKFNSKVLMLVLMTFVMICSCKKLITVDLPIDQISAEVVYNDVKTAVPTVNSIYAFIGKDGLVADNGVSIRCGLLSDELIASSGGDVDYNLGYNGDQGWRLWDKAYLTLLYRIHSAIEGIQKSTTLPQKAKAILTGEMKFTRAWVYFMLVNAYGDVPLVTGTDYKINAQLPRSPKSEVYKMIVSDLLEAQTLLDNNYYEVDLSRTSPERLRPNKATATAMLARVYLYLGRWEEAETQATSVIDNPAYELVELDQVFLKQSKEAIWQVQPDLLNPDGANAPDGRWLINPYGFLILYPISTQLNEAFEQGDLRKSHWVSIREGQNIAYKYKQEWGMVASEEYSLVFRLAEQYLIRSEARAKQNKLIGENSAVSDLNTIRQRAGLLGTNATTQTDILTAIDHERRVELFLEWGDRWFNLKRNQQLDDIMRPLALARNTIWQSHKALLPIPWTDFNNNPSLRGHQNPGYTEQ